MQKCLYLLCPTDCLEPVINRNFRNENYFYTSLGNSVVFNTHTILQIKKLVKKYEIRKIYFILSKNNNIILDALGKQDYLKFRGLNSFYNKLVRQKEDTEILWKTEYSQRTIISYYFNKKIKELESKLINKISHPVEISGKIYDRFENTFRNIYPKLVCLEKYHLN